MRGTCSACSQVRPPVVHRFGCGPLREGEAPPGVRVFKHRLLQHFMLSLFCKLPVQPMTRIADMRAAFMVHIPATACMLLLAYLPHCPCRVFEDGIICYIKGLGTFAYSYNKGTSPAC